MTGQSTAAAERLRQRFLENAQPEPNSGCWLWLGAPNSRGYGTIRVNGKTNQAHRVSYRLFKGEPGGLLVCHHCDNRVCVNPDHLFLGTDADNAQDRDRKGRSVMPDRSALVGAAKLAAQRTHCPSGHPLSNEHLAIDRTRGWRFCRTCKNEQKRARNAAARLCAGP